MKKKKTKKKARKSAPKKRRTVKHLVKRFVSRLVGKTKPKMAATHSAPPLTEAQVQKFREILTQRRDDLLAIVQRKKEQEIQDVEVGDEADIATQSIEKEILFELTDSEQQTLDMIEDALRKMDKGIYGSCESCRKTIPRMRLDVMPWARYCIRCQSEQEVPSGE